MGRLPVLMIGLLVLSAGQLHSQTTDRTQSLRDPFGRDDLAPAQVRKPYVRPGGDLADQAKNGASSRVDDLFPPVVVTEACQRIERALNRDATFEYLDQQLKDVIEDISFNHNIPIVFDSQALKESGIDPCTPITTSLKGIRLRSALRLTLRELGLTFVIRDEVLQITTLKSAESATSTRFYQVKELLPSNGDGEVLVEMIKTLVAPATWCGGDRVGSIIFVAHLDALAIRQTDQVFHEIEELLATTKRLSEKKQ